MRNYIIPAALLLGVTPIHGADVTSKQVLFTMNTLAAAHEKCGVEFNTTGDARIGWAMVATLSTHEQSYIDNYTYPVMKLVYAASIFPTFCTDVENAYGANGIPAPELPWFTPVFRGILK
jgi:hypothetical protein